jgi:transcriptional regulator with XRE-family HTH domain
MAVAGYVNMQGLGERVLVLRRRMALSQHGLADKAGVDVMTISRLERGDKKRLEVEPLARLAEALGVTTDYLLGRDTPKRRRSKLEEEAPAPTPPPKRPRPRKAAPAREELSHAEP